MAGPEFSELTSNQEGFVRSPESSFSFLYNVTHEASSRLSSRMWAERNNLPLKKMPWGGEEGLDPILSFLPVAKDGLALNLRSERVFKKQVRGLLSATTPQTLSSFSDLLEDFGARIKPHIVRVGPELSVYRHTFATISFLSKVGLMTTEEPQIGTPFDNADTYSYWRINLTTDNIWDLMCEMEDATRKLILDYKFDLRRTSALKATHFFEVSSNLASQLV